MNFSELFIRRPVMSAIVMAMILLLGFLSFQKLPVTDLPNVEYPIINVQSLLPGQVPKSWPAP